jgi:creatinine amidohydrolase
MTGAAGNDSFHGAATERRYERLLPRELEARVAESPIAYVPVGTLEFHGPHLPFGVDSFTSHRLCLEAAGVSGGVVLPPVYLAAGCLDMPFTLTFDHELVHAWVRATLDQLALRGFRAAVVLTGHGPLDLNHLLKRACREAEAARTGFAAYGLCWLELNASRLSAPEAGEPTVVDHAAMVETSWMLALEPELVRLERLSDDPAARHEGVYGPNPRFTASEAFGRGQIEACAALLAARARDLVAGRRVDVLADLRTFVEHGWPERPQLAARAGEPAELLLTNPGRASRYVSGVRVALDGTPVDPGAVVLVNRSPGEAGVPVRASELSAERGFYVRRGQTATLTLEGVAAPPGPRDVRLELELGGVTTLALDERVEFAA